MFFMYIYKNMDSNGITYEQQQKYEGSKTQVQYSFNYPIDLVWSQLKNIPKWLSQLEVFKDFEIPENDKEMWENGKAKVGTRLKYKYNVAIQVEIEIIELVEEKFYKKLVFDRVYNIVNLNYRQEYYLFSNSSDNSCLLKYNLLFESTAILGDVLMKEMNFERTKLCRANNKYFSKIRKKKYEQSESSIIQKPKSFIWKIISNFDERFSKIIKGVADEVTSESNPLKLYSKVNFKYLKEKIGANFIVTELQSEEKNKQWSMSMSLTKTNKLEILESENKKYKSDIDIIKEEEHYYTPDQEIIFELTDIKNNCFLVIKHRFQAHIDSETLHELSKSKINMLNELKTFCERK